MFHRLLVSAVVLVGLVGLPAEARPGGGRGGAQRGMRAGHCSSRQGPALRQGCQTGQRGRIANRFGRGGNFDRGCDSQQNFGRQRLRGPRGQGPERCGTPQPGSNWGDGDRRWGRQQGLSRRPGGCTPNGNGFPANPGQAEGPGNPATSVGGPPNSGWPGMPGDWGPPELPGNSGPHGNNGVGNGIDPQPPGNPPVNDGPGTGPGNPGRRGGRFR